jgi:hypothetical protein
MRAVLLILVALAAAACGFMLLPAGFATSVRNPRERTDFVPVLGGRDRGGVVPVVVGRTVAVSLDCSQ